MSTPGCYPSVIALVPALPHTKGLGFQHLNDSHVLHDGPHGTDEEVALAADPRAVHRKLTGEYFVTYQTGWNRTRRTTISSSKTPREIATWKRFPNSMFDKDDCATTLWFPDDDDETVAVQDKRVLAIATFGTLRGGNLSLVESTDGAMIMMLV